MRKEAAVASERQIINESRGDAVFDVEGRNRAVSRARRAESDVAALNDACRERVLVGAGVGGVVNGFAESVISGHRQPATEAAIDAYISGVPDAVAGRIEVAVEMIDAQVLRPQRSDRDLDRRASQIFASERVGNHGVRGERRTAYGHRRRFQSVDEVEIARVDIDQGEE